MTISIVRVDNNAFDFSLNGESFRLSSDRDLTVDGGKILDPIKGIIFQSELEEEELAKKLYESNKESAFPVGDNPKIFYGVKWKFDDESVIA